MPRDDVTFAGRRRGAVGLPWPYAKIVTAPTAVAAVAALYASYEAIASAEVSEVGAEAPALPHDRVRLRPGVQTGCGQVCAECYVIPLATTARIGSAVWHARAGSGVSA